MSIKQKERSFVSTVLVLLFILVIGLPKTKAQSQARDQSGAPVWQIVGDSNQANAPNATLAVPVKAFTTMGSTGTIDADSLPIAEVKNFTLSLRPSLVGTVTARFNITPTDGISSFCPATQSQVLFRYRNSDASGATANVTWQIRSSNIASGGNNLVVAFPGGFANGGSFFTVSGTLGVGFDFSTNIYWLEVTVFRNNAAQFADFGSFRLWESAGTPCP